MGGLGEAVEFRVAHLGAGNLAGSRPAGHFVKLAVECAVGGAGASVFRGSNAAEGDPDDVLAPSREDSEARAKALDDFHGIAWLGRAFCGPMRPACRGACA